MDIFYFKETYVSYVIDANIVKLKHNKIFNSTNFLY